MSSSFITSSGLGTTGLHNNGSTCYFNSIIQCLLNTVEFRQYIIHKDFIKDVVGIMASEKKKEYYNFMSYHLSYLLSELWFKNYLVCDPKSLLKIFVYKHTEYKIGYQHDSHEALKTILDDFHMELSREVKITYPNLKKEIGDLMKLRNEYIYLMKNESGNKDRIEDAKVKYELYLKDNPERALVFKSYKSWSDYIKKFKCSKITELFDNIILNCVVCSECKSESYTFGVERFIILPLPSKEKETSLHACLYNMSYPEILGSSESYKCSNCNKKVLYAKKYASIWEPANVLIILLQRFKHSGLQYVKNPINVIYPLELNISSYLSPKIKNKKDFKYDNYNYELYATSNHHGNMDSGHYTAFAKNSNDNKWRIFNDTYVSEISSPISSDAYILCYSLKKH